MLREVVRSWPCIGLRELARKAGVTVSAAGRALDSLRVMGLVEQTAAGRYHGSARLAAGMAAGASNLLRFAYEFGPLSPEPETDDTGADGGEEHGD